MLTAVNSGTVCVEGRRKCVNRHDMGVQVYIYVCTLYVMYTYASMCEHACWHVSIC